MKSLAVAVLLLGLFGVASCGEPVVVISEVENVSHGPKAPPWAKVAQEQIAEAKKHGVPVAFENDLGMRFVLIPAGTFVMGSPEDEVGRGDDEAQHEVTITKPYYMQITEVTNGQYRRYRPDHDSGSFFSEYAINGDGQPVGNVSWSDAMALTKELGALDSKPMYRLPTEAEWEYACRAGALTRFSFGGRDEELVGHGNFSDKNNPEGGGRMDLDDGYGASSPVGSLKPNRWGLHDMHGNVWEWCVDESPPHSKMLAELIAPLGAEMLRVQRGGSWSSGPKWARCAARDFDLPDRRRPDFGFRLVSPLPVR